MLRTATDRSPLAFCMHHAPRNLEYSRNQADHEVGSVTLVDLTRWPKSLNSRGNNATPAMPSVRPSPSKFA
jgi:hypothetical protein